MPTMTTAAVVKAAGDSFTRTDVQLDDPRPGEVLLRIEAVGLCHSDLSVRSGKTPFPLPGVLGHEGAGVVEAVGPAVSKVAAGDRVVVTFDSCGRCIPCLTGRPSQCAHWPALNLLGGSRLDGSATITRPDGEPVHGHFFGQSSFARHALASERNVVKVVGDTPLDLLAPLGCGVQTGAGAILNVLRPHPGSTVAIFGAGAVGLSALIAAQLSPATQIVAVDVQEPRLALAADLGATATVNPRRDDPVRFLHALGGAHYALETSGNTAVLRQAVDSLAGNGVCAVVGAPPFGSEVSLDVPAMLTGNPHIVGVNQGSSVPDEFLPALMTLQASGRLPFDRLITHFDFDDIEDAASAAVAGDAVKPVLRMR
jgi:aryl-alcohol dehydrogenase